jgi:hypothetical protein
MVPKGKKPTSSNHISNPNYSFEIIVALTAVDSKYLQYIMVEKPINNKYLKNIFLVLQFCYIILFYLIAL